MIEVVTPWMGHPELIEGYEAAMQGARCIIIDQASDPETARALDAMVERLGNGSLVIHNETNRHFAAANNQGLAAAAGDVVCFVNNDVYGTGTPPNVWLGQIARDVKPGGLYG